MAWNEEKWEGFWVGLVFGALLFVVPCARINPRHARKERGQARIHEDEAIVENVQGNHSARESSSK